MGDRYGKFEIVGRRFAWQIMLEDGTRCGMYSSKRRARRDIDRYNYLERIRRREANLKVGDER